MCPASLTLGRPRTHDRPGAFEITLEDGTELFSKLKVRRSCPVSSRPCHSDTEANHQAPSLSMAATQLTSGTLQLLFKVPAGPTHTTSALLKN